jgi:diguanylate cyclase (GGDEF)-like protein
MAESRLLPRHMPLLNVLLVDESDRDASDVSQSLARAGYEVTLTRVDTPDALTTALRQGQWDVVVSDYSLAGLSGADALALVQQHAADLPFIFVSGTHGEETAVEAMRLGAHDFITKRNVARLAPSVHDALRVRLERRERLRENERLAYLAFHDELTDLPNRTLLHDRLHQGLLEAKREMRPLSLLVLDLDGFKEINDLLGHHAGDQVLQIVASRLRAALRQSDTVARLGGDEFAILLPITDAQGAELAATKILQELELPMVLDGGRPAFVRGSVGVAAFPEHGTSEQELLHKADTAMYVAKNDRSGQATYSVDRDGRAERRIAFVAEMWHGIDEGQFALEYQPIVDLRTNETIALESLLRWNHPRYGRLSPDQFIQVAEHSGLITRLTLFAIERALIEWPPARHALTLAVNVSPRSLHDASFARRVRDHIESLHANPSLLTLEITESVAMANSAGALQTLNELHAMGLKIAIDDFGTGYSSLSHLRRLPVSQLKIDRSFIHALAQGEDVALVRSIIDLAHNLKLQVVAEGVDSAEIRNQLEALGCDAAQGHLFSAPAPAATLALGITQRDRSRFESA